MRSLALFVLAACSSSAPPPAQPVTALEPPIDAAPDAVATRPTISINATVYVFRFSSAVRAETWTLSLGAAAVIRARTARRTC